MVNMRLPDEASSTRTRILDAAIERFGRDGFDASLRTIAADADVSAATIIKAFGSKEDLHRACDDRIRLVLSHYKNDAMRSSDLRGIFVAQMAIVDEFQPLIRYLVRSLMTGGDVARTFIGEMHAEAAQWMRQGVESGHVKPSRDEDARVKLTFSISLGWMLQAVLTSGRSLGELDAEFWARTTREIMLPSLELYTEGLLTDRTLLDTYLQSLEPDDGGPSDGTTPAAPNG